MLEQDLQLSLPAGTLDAVLFTPDPATPLPGVLHLPDIFSIRDSHREMAGRLAAQGYAVLMVNPFYRTSRPPVFDFPRKGNEERIPARIAELVAPLTPEAQDHDVAIYVDLLASQSAVRPGPLGAVGFCFSGTLAMRCAAIRPAQIAAAASFHGGGLYKADNPASPHLLLPEIKARLYFGHAVEDRSMTAEQISLFEAALKSWGGSYESETYAGSHHGWTVPDNPAYNPPQADRAFEKLVELFKATLN